MGLETATYLDDLNIANPLGGDGKSEGDNHIRLMKEVLKNTLPGLAGRAWRYALKSTNYTVLPTDNMTFLYASAAITFDLPAVATAGNGFMFVLRASVGNDVTVDPNAAETIDALATYTLPGGQAALLFCSGSDWKVLELDYLTPWVTSALRPTAKGDLLAGTAADAGVLLPAGANGTVLQADSGEASGLKWSGVVSHSQVKGQLGVNNGVTPATQWDMSAEQITFTDEAGGGATKYGQGSVTVDILLTGPAANGRDQAGAFTASWVYFYWIRKSTDGTIAGIASNNGPATGPAGFPTDYDQWAFAGAAYFNGTIFANMYQRGSKMFYQGRQTALSGSTAGSFTAQSVSTLVPSEAPYYSMECVSEGLGDATGKWRMASDLSVDGASVFRQHYSETQGSTTSPRQHRTSGPYGEIPNVGQQFYHRQTALIGSSHSHSAYVTHYTVPNGDS